MGCQTQKQSRAKKIYIQSVQEKLQENKKQKEIPKEDNKNHRVDPQKEIITQDFNVQQDNSQQGYPQEDIESIKLLFRQKRLLIQQEECPQCKQKVFYYLCNACNLSIWCSFKCALKDPQHQECIQFKRKYSIMGLQNLGNTCYMNSALQCLLHTPPLVDYFLADNWQKDLNIKNKFGTGGKITEEFANLIKKAYQNKQGSYIPASFQRQLTNLAPQFTEGDQHDSQQFMNFLLDALHEDLNKITEKLYLEAKPNDGRSDEVIAQEW